MARPAKTWTTQQAETAYKRAVAAIDNFNDGDDPHGILNMDVSEYADYKGVEIVETVENPQTFMTKTEYQERIDELETENESLRGTLSAIKESVDDELNDDDDDFDDEDDGE